MWLCLGFSRNYEQKNDHSTGCGRGVRSEEPPIYPSEDEAQREKRDRGEWRSQGQGTKRDKKIIFQNLEFPIIISKVDFFEVYNVLIWKACDDVTSQNTVTAIMSVFEPSVKHKMWAAGDKLHIEISVSVCLQHSP